MARKGVVIVGNRGVGKTSLINRLLNDSFSYSYEPTSNTTIYSYKDIDIYDIPGVENLENLKELYSNVSYVIVMFDITDKFSFDSVRYCINDIRRISLKVKIILLLSKDDIKKERIKTKKVSNLIECLACSISSYIRVSSKEDINCLEVFNQIV